MASKKKKKYYQQPKATTSQTAGEQRIESKSPKMPKRQMTSMRFALIVTAAYFVVALIGMLSHEMWRDEHQAWLVARDANSLSQLLDNMNYEGNPALWHFFLFLITRVTHDPIYMQAFHLLVATSFIFIFNRYAPLKNLHKILFSFGYFALYEYAVISRSYALGVLLIFAICALYHNRITKYILIGVLLALLANVTIYAVIIAGGLAAILVLDYFLYQQKSSKAMMQLAVSMSIFILGVAFSLYQIWPEKDNSFPAQYAESLGDTARWGDVLSRILTTYFYVPKIEEHFWNTSIYSPGGTISGGLVFFSLLVFIAGICIFLRKPLSLLLYILTAIGLFSVFYYTALLHSRYCGYLLIALVSCYWIAGYYPERKYYGFLAGLGKKISNHFLTGVLFLNVIGAVVAYSMDVPYKFSTSKQAADYIKQNKLDSLPVVGVTDFIVSPLATYLDTRIQYPQMNGPGSFTIWSKKRNDGITVGNVMSFIAQFMDQGRQKILWVTDQVGSMDKTIVRNDLQFDLIKDISPGIVNEEQYFIYLVQKVDPSKVDYSRYVKFN